LAPEDRFELTPTTDAYYQYLLNLGNQPERIWAHIYVWHMGDLYGGQMIKRLVPGSSAALEFENKDQLILFIRTHCTTDMADEAKLAFEYAIKIMNELF
jgi:heme oxygenase